MIGQFFISLTTCTGQTINRKDLFLFQFCHYKPNVFFGTYCELSILISPWTKRVLTSNFAHKRNVEGHCQGLYSYFEKGCQKKCAYDNLERYYGICSIHCSWHCSCRIYFCSFPLAFADLMSMASPAILSNFFEKRWTQNHPQYLSGLLHALQNDNLSQNSCIWDISHPQLNWLKK